MNTGGPLSDTPNSRTQSAPWRTWTCDLCCGSTALYYLSYCSRSKDLSLCNYTSTYDVSIIQFTRSLILGNLCPSMSPLPIHRINVYLIAFNMLIIDFSLDFLMNLLNDFLDTFGHQVTLWLGGKLRNGPFLLLYVCQPFICILTLFLIKST